MTAGRPSKIESFTKAMGMVLYDGMNAIIMTDEELFLLANELLGKEDSICYATFKKYKKSSEKEEKALYKEFIALYKKALLKQKSNLFEKLGNENHQQWQRYAWIIERKFSDWNLRNIGETKVDSEIKFIIK